MRELENLKNKLCRELEEYSQRNRLDASNIQIIDTLAHTIKNLNKIIDHESENGYSEAPHMRGTYSYRGDNDYNYGSRRNMGDWRANDYSMGGRYAMGSNEMMNTLTRLMNETPDARVRMEFQKFIDRMEQM